MNQKPKSVKAKRPSRPVYVEVRRLVDPATGEEIGCLVPMYKCDRRALRDRGFAVGTELRCELKKARNPKFHRLAHAIGSLVVDQIPEFEGLDAHEAARKYWPQLDAAGVEELVRMEMGR